MDDTALALNPLVSRQEVARIHDDLFRWCQSRCGYDRDTAEDLMQQTYVEILTGKAQFSGKSTLKTFLFGVAQKLASQHFRKKTTRSRLDALNHAHTEPLTAVAESPDTFDKARIWDAVRELSFRQRDIIELVFCNEQTVEDAAHIMNISVGTARVHYDRAKKALAEKLADLHDDLRDPGNVQSGIAYERR